MRFPGPPGTPPEDVIFATSRSTRYFSVHRPVKTQQIKNANKENRKKNKPISSYYKRIKQVEIMKL